MEHYGALLILKGIYIISKSSSSASTHKTLPTLIVLDNNMPLMPGSKALNRIIEFEQLKAIPVAFFTTGKLAAEQHIITHHAKLFLKPASYVNYIETIRQNLGALRAGN